MRVYFYVLIFLLLPFAGLAQIIVDSLFINSGVTQFEPGGPSFPYLAPNEQDPFSTVPQQFRLAPGDTLRIFLFNNDSVNHQLEIKETGEVSPLIPAGNTASWELSFTTPGIYQYRGVGPNEDVVGLSGMIVVWDFGQKDFFWALREHQSDLNDKIFNGILVDLDSFQPDYFSINGQSHPALQSDSSAVVYGNVGDTIFIFVSNLGLMDHSIHFHGYHVDLVYSSVNNWQVGWNKDSIPLKAKESQIYRLVPHQEGTFPVHDHNLVATTIGGNAPGGMLVLITIDP